MSYLNASCHRRTEEADSVEGPVLDSQAVPSKGELSEIPYEAFLKVRNLVRSATTIPILRAFLAQEVHTLRLISSV